MGLRQPGQVGGDGVDVIEIHLHRAGHRLSDGARFRTAAAGIGFVQLKGSQRTVASAKRLPHRLIIAPILEAETIGFAETCAEEGLQRIHIGFAFQARRDIPAATRLLPIHIALLES